jgi:hypothetical protein
VAERVQAAVLLNFVAGLVSAFVGAVLGALDPSIGHASPLAHLPHQLLLAVPLGLAATLLLRPEGPRLFWIGAGAAASGLALGNVVIAAGVGFQH